MHPLAPILCTVAPATVCALAHYFPWRFWFKRGRLPRLLAYVLGLLSIILPVSVALLFVATALDALILLWLAAASAGLGTLIPWWWDWHNRTELQRQDAAERDALYGE